jgi:hypothetical protein
LIGTRMIYKKENRTAFSMIKHSYYFEKAWRFFFPCWSVFSSLRRSPCRKTVLLH